MAQSITPNLHQPQVFKDNRIFVSKKAWIFRILSLLFLVTIAIFLVIKGIQLQDPFIIHTVIASSYSIMVLGMAWFLYRVPAKKIKGNPLVSVIIPVYNQKKIISDVISAISNSTYQNFEIIAVDDGSTDGTRIVLDELARSNSKLVVIHKKNEGKRKTVSQGFMKSKGEIILNIDSDSIIHPKAIEELLKAFSSDSKIGAVVGNVRVLNGTKRLMPKIQDIWYDISFNLNKGVESIFGTVICCSGCMAAYRRKAILQFIPYWSTSPLKTGDDRQLTSLVIAKPGAKIDLLSSFAQKRLQHASSYDDAEDRILTGQSLIEWKTKYVASAVAFTEVPSTLRQFLKQQTRWKKGYLRGQFFCSTFFWRKHPIMAFMYYLEFMATVTAPLVIFTVLIYEPLITKQYWFTIFFVVSQVLMGFIEGIDSKFRNPKMKNWKYKPLMNLFAIFILPWVIFPTLINFRKNNWGTR